MFYFSFRYFSRHIYVCVVFFFLSVSHKTNKSLEKKKTNDISNINANKNATVMKCHSKIFSSIRIEFGSS